MDVSEHELLIILTRSFFSIRDAGYGAVRKEHLLEGEFHRCTTQEHHQRRKTGND